ncbi:hypothetical protein [Microbulbifer sp. Q7]|uniref:hypothetical protein n=1 Tax=Microbulbifer sp. Q7 TaxID=1785091 RepID=UPI0008320A7E|nr:hypothetical protein [Microbulbifer sp. Q7]
MSELTYSVIFRGDLQPGYTAADVKANFARLFKTGPDTVEKLFSGRPLAIKKGLARAQAEQLQATLTKLGAVSAVKAEEKAQQETATDGAAAPAKAAPPSASASPVAAEESGPQATQVQSSETGLTLAPMEGYLLKEHERSKVEPVQVPVSHLSLKPATGNLVEPSEQPSPPPVQVQVPNWQLGSHVTGKASFKLPD